MAIYSSQQFRNVWGSTPPKTIHYRYDALGRRIEREDTSTNAWQRYTHDGWEVRFEENSDGSWVSYVNGNDIDDHLRHWLTLNYNT